MQGRTSLFIVILAVCLVSFLALTVLLVYEHDAQKAVTSALALGMLGPGL